MESSPGARAYSRNTLGLNIITLSPSQRGNVKIPKEIKLGAQTVRVELVDSLEGHRELGNAIGHSSGSINRILLSRSVDDPYTGGSVLMPESVMTDTFLHEIIHMVSINYGIGLDENQVMGLAGALLQVIRENNLDFRK